MEASVSQGLQFCKESRQQHFPFSQLSSKCQESSRDHWTDCSIMINGTLLNPIQIFHLWKRPSIKCWENLFSFFIALYLHSCTWHRCLHSWKAPSYYIFPSCFASLTFVEDSSSREALDCEFSIGQLMRHHQCKTLSIQHSPIKVEIRFCNRLLHTVYL